MILNFQTSVIKKLIIKRLEALRDQRDFRLSANFIFSEFNSLLYWYRKDEVATISASSLVSSVLNNREDSKPLGCRNYNRMHDNVVTIPDGLKVNDVFLYLSVIFCEGQSLVFKGSNQIVEVNGFGPNSTYIKCFQDTSYWREYLTTIVYVFNKGKSNDSKTSNFNNTSNTSINLKPKGTRGFSTQREASNRVED